MLCAFFISITRQRLRQQDKASAKADNEGLSSGAQVLMEEEERV